MHYPFPIHRTEAYADLGLGAGSLPVAERLAEQICTLPLFPYMSDDEVAHVVDAVRDFDREAHDHGSQVRPNRDAPLRVAVVGYGYWGPNLVRNVIERPELELAGLCERDPERARRVLRAEPRRAGLRRARRAARASPTSTRCSWRRRR